MTQEAGTRSYEVQTSDGTYRRNRRVLVELPDIPDQTESNEGVMDTSSSHTAEPLVRRSSRESWDTSSSHTAEPLVRRSSRESRPPDQYDPSWN